MCTHPIVISIHDNDIIPISLPRWMDTVWSVSIHRGDYIGVMSLSWMDISYTSFQSLYTASNLMMTFVWGSKRQFILFWLELWIQKAISPKSWGAECPLQMHPCSVSVPHLFVENSLQWRVMERGCRRRESYLRQRSNQVYRHLRANGISLIKEQYYQHTEQPI